MAASMAWRLLDLDHFKRINDVHGHAAGDRVLQTFAAVARACLRDGDVVARYGGEEFVLLLPNTEADQFTARAASACVRPSAAPSRLGVQVRRPECVHRHDPADACTMTSMTPCSVPIRRLYQAKRDGRNRCAATWEDVDA